MNIDFRILALLIGYCIGLIQTAYIVGRMVAKIDIRERGTGNAGAANIFTIIGARAATVVLVTDVLKGILAFVICAILWNGGGTFMGDGSVLPGFYGALGAILGHSFPFYLKFRGGKGFASAMGLMIAVDIWMFFIALGAGLIILLITRYTTVATLAVTAAMPITLHVFAYSPEVVVMSVFVVALVWYLHRANISKLLNGEEKKFEFKYLVNRKRGR